MLAHGFILTPRAPFVVTHAASFVEVTYFDEAVDAVRAARIHFDGGAPRVELENARELGEVCDVTPSASGPEVRIETSLFSCAFPEGFELRAAEPPMDPGPFDLVGPSGELFFVQTPKNVPRLEQMVAPGQRVVRLGDDDIELAYEHDGQAWTQIYVRMDGHILTAQAPSSAPGWRDVLGALRESFRLG